MSLVTQRVMQTVLHEDRRRRAPVMADTSSIRELLRDLTDVQEPFDIDDLIARLTSLKQAVCVYTSERLEVNFRTAEVWCDGASVSLTTLELDLLEYFIDHPNEVLSRDELLDRVWGYEATPVTRTVDVRIAALRRKLERDPGQPEMIVTVHGAGYKFIAPA